MILEHLESIGARVFQWWSKPVDLLDHLEILGLWVFVFWVYYKLMKWLDK